MCVLCEGCLMKSLQKLRTSRPEVVWRSWTRPAVIDKQGWVQWPENVTQGNSLYLGRVLIWDWSLFLSYKPNFAPRKKIHLSLAASVTIVWDLTFVYNMRLVLTWLLLVMIETVLSGFEVYQCIWQTTKMAQITYFLLWFILPFLCLSLSLSPYIYTIWPRILLVQI